jgi:hypothetical protein
MKGRIRARQPSAALTVAVIALIAALSGTAPAQEAVDFAKTKLLNGKNIKNKSIAGSKLRNDTVTGTQVSEAKLGKVPSATKADSATSATSAATATNATTAANATNATNAANATDAVNATNATTAATATNASQLGGLGVGSFQRKTAQSGDVLAGQLSLKYIANSGFAVAGAGYPVPLPAGVATPTVAWATSTTVQCPGIGQSTAGVLCVYDYASQNINSVNSSTGSGGENKRFGFSADVFPVTASDPGQLIASWAYQVP